MSVCNVTTDSRLDFDGTTVLCQVCGDKASGFHYGVHSCEGCKGFFRRSIQQKIQYKPCTKSQDCSILRINRNRCQYCRLKKCISVGMSRDAVRFGRVPKREKAKILAAMQSVNQKYQEQALLAELDDSSRLVRRVTRAHLATCDFTWDKVAPLLQAARLAPSFVAAPASSPESASAATPLACPLSPRVMGPDGRLADSQLFGRHIRAVVEFAKQLPGFMRLPDEDRVTLLKSSVFEVLLIWLACMFDSKTRTATCLNGQLFSRDAFAGGSQSRFLLDSMFVFAEQLNALRLHDAELALFCACVVFAPERAGLRSVRVVSHVHGRLDAALRRLLLQNRPTAATESGGGGSSSDNTGGPAIVAGRFLDGLQLYECLRGKVHDLKTLNALHSDMIRSLKQPPATAAASSSVAGCAGAASSLTYGNMASVGGGGGECWSPPAGSLSSGYVGSEEGSEEFADSSPSPPSPATASVAAAAVAAAVATVNAHPHLVAALAPAAKRIKLELADVPVAAAVIKTERQSPQPAATSDDYMPLLKQALSKPNVQQQVNVSPVSAGAAAAGARVFVEQAFVPHKKFRWMRVSRDASAVDSVVDGGGGSDDEKSPPPPHASVGDLTHPAVSVDSGGNSQTPTLSRILGAPSSRVWSLEEVRRREAVAHLLSMQSGELTHPASRRISHSPVASVGAAVDSRALSCPVSPTSSPSSSSSAVDAFVEPLNLSKKLSAEAVTSPASSSMTSSSLMTSPAQQHVVDTSS